LSVTSSVFRSRNGDKCVGGWYLALNPAGGGYSAPPEKPVVVLRRRSRGWVKKRVRNGYSGRKRKVEEKGRGKEGGKWVGNTEKGRVG